MGDQLRKKNEVGGYMRCCDPDCNYPACDCWELKQRFSQDNVKKLEADNAQLIIALQSLMPILQQWEPDHSTAEERQAWSRATKLLSDLKK